MREVLILAEFAGAAYVAGWIYHWLLQARGHGAW